MVRSETRAAHARAGEKLRPAHALANETLRQPCPLQLDGEIEHVFSHARGNTESIRDLHPAHVADEDEKGGSPSWRLPADNLLITPAALAYSETKMAFCPPSQHVRRR